MKLLSKTKPLFVASAIVSLTITLSACGGGGGSSAPVVASSAPASSAASVVASSVPASSAPALSSSSITSSSASSVAVALTGMAALIRDGGGVFILNSDEGTLLIDSQIADVNGKEFYNGTSFVPDITLPEGAGEIVLSSNGWVAKSGLDKFGSYNADGSVTSQDSVADGDKTMFSFTEELDLTGQKMVDVLLAYPISAEHAGIISPAAVFASGAKAYKVTFSFPAKYTIGFNAPATDGTCYGNKNNFPANGNCNDINMSAKDNVTEADVADYSKLFSADVAVNATGYRSVSVGSTGTGKLSLQIISDAAKTVKFYETAWDGTAATFIATGTWSEITLPNLVTDNKALRVNYPASVLAVSSIWNPASPNEIIIAKQDGFLRGVELSAAEEESGLVVFNNIANANYHAATVGYTNPLVGNWKFGENTFVFSNNNTFTQVKTATDDPNCAVGSAIGTYSWNPLTSTVNVRLRTDSTNDCTFEGSAKLTLSENSISFINDEGEPIFFTKTTSATGLAGTWVLNDEDEHAVLLFTDTQYFLSDYHADGGYGTESGTYTFNAGTATFTPSVLKDANDDAGFSDRNNTPWSLVISEDNNSFTIGDGYVLKRLK